jgi:hypothetical protein
MPSSLTRQARAWCPPASTGSCGVCAALMAPPSGLGGGRRQALVYLAGSPIVASTPPGAASSW